MKSLLTLVLVLIISQYSVYPQAQIRDADYYFDAVNGNNSNDGFTPQTAKKDLNGFALIDASNLTNKTIAFRDSMYYRRTSFGDAAIYIASNISGLRLTNWYDGVSWRDGHKLPVIACSYRISNWSLVSGNIWQAISGGNNSLVFEYSDSIRWGIARSSIDSLTKERDFLKFDSTFYCFSPEDPDNRFVSIESYRQDYGIQNLGDDNSFDNLDIRFAGGVGIAFEQEGEYCTIRDSKIQFIGNSVALLSGTGAEGVYLHATGSKCVNNWISEVTHHTVFIYNTTGNPFSDITVDSNVVNNGHYNFFDMNGGTISGVKIRYNIAYDDEWAEYRQEPNYTGRNGGFWTNGSVQDVLVAYNLVYNMYEAVLCDFRVGQITVHNNTFVQTRPGNLGGFVVINYGDSGSVWKNNILARNGGPIGSIPSGSSNNFLATNLNSVDWINWQEKNFRLNPESDAINFGVDLGYEKDLDGNPIIGLPDAGCYEFAEYGSYIIVTDGWNFLSVPKLSSNMTSNYLFPTRISEVMKYVGNGYQIVNELENTKGYAVKFEQPENIFIEGTLLYFPVPVTEGWNLIGPFEEDIPISQIVTSPPGIISSNFFSYNGTQYVTDNLLKPGKGYWIKVSEDGFLNLHSSQLITK